MMTFFVYLTLALIAFWTFKDAQSRGKSPGVSLFWALMVFFFWIFALPLWLYLRPNKLALMQDNY